MTALVEVAFKGNRKEFFRWEGDEPLPERAAVIVDADRGEDLGVVHSQGELAALRDHRLAHGTHGVPPERRILRPATPEEIGTEQALRAEHDEQARHRARELVQQHGLLMKVTDAEWQFDRRKLTLYFTADKRVDFRALVRDLASAFHARIELKQIGVRDEARRLSGIGRCGREYCSASWLPELLPVNLGIAKDQKLSLNPTQISGACGRLMCCLRYEHDFYVQSRKRFPKEGKILSTSVGEERVIANDIFREAVTLRNAEGDVRVVPLAALKREMAIASGAAPDAAAGDPDDSEAGDVGLARRLPLMHDAHASASASPVPSLLHETAAQAPTHDSPTASAAPGATQPSAEGEDVRAILSGREAAADADTDAAGLAVASDECTGTGSEAVSEESEDDQSARRRRRRGRRGGRRTRGVRDDAGSTEAGGRSPDEFASGADDQNIDE